MSKQLKQRYKVVENDVVLIAGKGHENYQIIGTTKYHFSDQERKKVFLSLVKFEVIDE